MKLSNQTKRIIAVASAAALTLGLTACGSQTDSASSAATAETATDETAAPDNSQYANFDYSAGLDSNGYWEGVTALDYVTLPENWNAFPIPESVSTVSDEDLQAQIDSLLAAYSTTDSVTDRAIESGDIVNIDYVGSVDGVEFTGGNTGGNGTDVEAGSANYIDDFLTQIIGHTPGETFNVTVTFPEDYADSTDADGNPVVLAGKEAVFVTTVNYIQETVTPELTDEFVAENLQIDYEASTVEELSQVLRQQLQDDAEYNYVVSQLPAVCTFADELPEALNEYQMNSMLAYYASYADAYGVSMDEFLSTYLGVESVDALQEAMQENLLANTRQYLAMQAVAESANLTATDEMVSDFFNGEDYASYTEYYGENYIRLNALDSAVVDHLIANSVSVADEELEVSAEDPAAESAEAEAAE